MTQRLVTAAYRYVMASGVPAALVQEGILGVDPVGGAYTQGWIFSGDPTGDPYRNVEGTGRAAVVLYAYDDWAASPSMHMLRFPRLHLAIYADPTRDSHLAPRAHEAQRKAEEVFERLNPLFHDAGNRIHAFADLRVISTLQGGGLSIGLTPNGDGVVRADVVYDVTLG